MGRTCLGSGGACSPSPAGGHLGTGHLGSGILGGGGRGTGAGRQVIAVNQGASCCPSSSMSSMPGPGSRVELSVN